MSTISMREQLSELLTDERPDSTATGGRRFVIQPGELCEYPGTFPIWHRDNVDLTAPPDEVKAWPSALDMRDSLIVCEFAQLYWQRRNDPNNPNWRKDGDRQFRAELRFALPSATHPGQVGARIGIMEDGVFEVDPVYDYAAGLNNRVLELHVESPFVPESEAEALYEPLRELLLSAGFMPHVAPPPNPLAASLTTNYTRDVDSTREVIWSLDAPFTSMSPVSRIRAQQAHGVRFDTCTILLGRPADQKYTPSGATQPLPEFENPSYSLYANVRRARAQAAAGTPQPNRLLSAVTGIEPRTGFAQRATLASYRVLNAAHVSKINAEVATIRAMALSDRVKEALVTEARSVAPSPEMVLESELFPAGALSGNAS